MCAHAWPIKVILMDTIHVVIQVVVTLGSLLVSLIIIKLPQPRRVNTDYTTDWLRKNR